MTEAETKRFAQRAAALSAAGLLAMATGLLREVALARRFGLSEAMDAYVAATFVSRLALALVAGSLLPAFILVFIRILERDEEDAWAFARAVTLWMGGLTLVACATAALTAHFWLPVFYPGYSNRQIATSVQISMLLLPALPILLVASVQSGILNARRRFALPVLGTAAGNLIVVSAAVLAPGAAALRWVAAATALSYVVQWGVQQPYIRHVRRSRSAAARPHVKEWLLLALPLLAYQGVAFASIIVEGRLASNLGPGTVSALGYAQRLFGIPTSLLVAPLAMVAYPTLVRRIARGDLEGARDGLTRVMRLVVFVFFPASAITIVFAVPLTSLFFQRGAFDASATATTASALAAYAIGMAPNALAVFMLRGLNAGGDTRTPLYVEMASLLLYLMAAIPLAATFGVAGLAGARAFGFASTALLLLFMLARRFDLLGRARAAVCYTTAVLGLSVALAVVLFAVGKTVTILAGSTAPSLRASLQLLASAGALAAYLAAARWWLRWPEADLVLHWIPRLRANRREGHAD